MAKYKVLEKTIDNKNNRVLLPGQIVEIEGLEKVGKNLELIDDFIPASPKKAIKSKNAITDPVEFAEFEEA